MSVTKEELQKATDILSQKIDDRHDKIIDKWDYLANSINGMNVSIGKFLIKLDHQEEANKRLSGDIRKIEARQQSMTESIIRLQTNQDNSRNFFDKFGVPIMLAAFFGLSAINYWKG